MAHEAFANVGLAELTGEGDATANHHTRADTQISHHRVMDRAGRVIEENVDARGTGFLYRGGKIGRLVIVDAHIESDFTTPLEFTVVAGDRHGPASGQFGDLADELP